jgi:hypothetical protein
MSATSKAAIARNREKRSFHMQIDRTLRHMERGSARAKRKADERRLDNVHAFFAGRYEDGGRECHLVDCPRHPDGKVEAPK